MKEDKQMPVFILHLLYLLFFISLISTDNLYLIELNAWYNHLSGRHPEAMKTEKGRGQVL